MSTPSCANCGHPETAHGRDGCYEFPPGSRFVCPCDMFVNISSIGTAPCFVIYRPTTSDYPGKWLCRRWVMTELGKLLPTSELHCEEALDGARKHVPNGMVRLPPAPDDDPVIEEWWV